MRIVKTWQEGRRRKVKALQRMLTHSLSGKALAVKRVTENQSKQTPGVDGETWSTPDSKSKAVLSLRRRRYQPRPLRRVYIPKSNGKMRPTGIGSLRSDGWPTCANGSSAKAYKFTSKAGSPPASTKAYSSFSLF